ncbi:hypothetical protein [Nocardioides nanhaiensis]|uniref:Septum formation-related domain-containing protein n=1 Tax=Nocardioides nanhaiensis TaxID=1476871 RepID=A0ABP8VTV4_9ACTN
MSARVLSLTAALLAALVLGSPTPATSATSVLPLAAASAPSGPATARTAPGLPRVGTCHQLSRRQSQAFSDTKRAVPCSGRHNTRTVSVVRVPGSVDLADFGQVYRAAGPACTRARARVLGSSVTRRALTPYLFNFFVPTAAQQRRGASWIRCDLGIRGAGDRLISLDEDLRLPDGPLPERLSACEDRRGYAVHCGVPHVTRSVGALQVGRAYPSPATVQRAAVRCQRFGAGRYDVGVPDELQWRAGNRVLVCDLLTRR